MTKVLERIYCKVYSNGPHFSATKKDGYTCYVPENLALALFLRAELEKIPDLTVQFLGQAVSDLAAEVRGKKKRVKRKNRRSR
jgi:hypothetical protein